MMTVIIIALASVVDATSGVICCNYIYGTCKLL